MLRALDVISKATRNNQLCNERMRQMVTMLYLHKTIVKSDGVHERAGQKLHETVERMYKNIEYYSGNDNILTSFEFFKKSVDIFFD